MSALSFKSPSWSRRERARRLEAPGLPNAFGRAAARVLLRPVWFFLAAGCFRRQSPRPGLLDFLGFPWILSSEISLFNGLRGIFEIIFFMGSLAQAGRGRAPRTGAFELWKSGIIHSSSVAQFPHFSNQLSSPAIRAEPLPHAEERGRSPARDRRAFFRAPDGLASRSMLPKRAPFVRLERPSRRAFGAPRDEGGEIPKTFGVAHYFATVAVNVT
jgi:hypothetical protein